MAEMKKADCCTDEPNVRDIQWFSFSNMTHVLESIDIDSEGVNMNLKHTHYAGERSFVFLSKEIISELIKKIIESKIK